MNAVEFDRVSKRYAIYDRPGDRLRELVTPGARKLHRDFHALADVTFSIRRGEVFCIIGENGSGKSTALQIMAGIMAPTSGDVRTAGRIAALLELGAGFNPEFTGRDNVLLNGSIMGFSGREMQRRYREIEEFAGIGEFIHQPVKTYSSGMVVRLAFAVAISVDAEILIVDEALAVGDTGFRRRCMRKVHELRTRGVTIVFVSHSVADVKAIGDRALWLDHGTIAAAGETGDVISQYLEAVGRKTAAEDAQRKRRSARPGSVAPVRSIPNIDARRGDGRAQILGIAILDEFGGPVHLMVAGMRLTVRVSVQAKAELRRPSAGFLLRNHLGLDFAELSTSASGPPLAPMCAGEIRTIDFHIEVPELYPGSFSFSPAISDAGAVGDWIENAITIQMAKGEGPVYGCIQLPCRVDFGERDTAGQASELEPSVA